MPTTDERREVAARLRTVTRNDTEAVYLGDILSALIGGFTVTEKNNETDELLVINRLADLIEPEPERTCANILNEVDSMAFNCSSCDAFYDGEGTFCNDDEEVDFSYCPNCGCRVKEG